MRTAVLLNSVFREGTRSGGTAPPPTTNIDFSAVSVIGDLPAGSTFTRASGATRINYRGYLEEVAANAMRPTYDPALVYNLVPNPWGAGAPDGWVATSSGGVTVTFLSTGIRNGIPYVRYRFAGTASASGALVFWGIAVASSPYVIPIPPGGDVRGEYYLEVVRLGAGHTPTTFSGAYRTFDVAGVAVANNTYTPSATNTRTFADGPIRNVIASAANAYMVRPQLAPTIAAASVVDIDIDIGFPVVSVGAYLTDTVPVATLAARKGTVPQYGIQGLLLEEASTNGFQNVRYEGGTPGVIGSGGVWPTNTNYVISSAHGFNTEIVAFFKENGYDVMRVRYTGTANIASSSRLPTQTGVPPVPAAVGQVWTHSVFVRLVSGAWGFSSSNIEVREYAGGAAGTIPVSAFFTPTTAWQRFSASGPLTMTAGVDGAVPTIRVAYSLGAVIDVTVDYAAPQLEAGPFPTSLILPPVGTPAASTRAREEFLLPPALGNSLVSGSHATCFILPRYGSAGKWPNSRSPYYCGDGTVGFMQWLTLATDVPQFSLRSGGVAQVLFTGPAPIPPDTPFAMCAAWGGGSSHASFAGTALIVDADALTPATVPTTFRVSGGLNPATVPSPNMILRYIRIWNGTKLTAAQVQRESGKT